MSFRLYLTPQIGTGTATDPWRPKYFDGFAKSGMRYGFQPVFLVAADLLPADDAAVLANADAFGFPLDLSPQLTGGQQTTASNALESFFIAANWITGSITWLTVARTTCGMFQFMQRLYGILGPVILLDGTSNKTLNTQFNQIPANVQQAIFQASADFGYDAGFIQNNTQVRAIFKGFADQWGSKPFIFGPFVI